MEKFTKKMLNKIGPFFFNLIVKVLKWVVKTLIKVFGKVGKAGKKKIQESQNKKTSKKKLHLVE